VALIKEYLKSYRDIYIGFREDAIALLGYRLDSSKKQGEKINFFEEYQLVFRNYKYSGVSKKVEIITPANAHFMTTFYDIDPISPSGRYLICTNVPFINRVPLPGDIAYICIVDLASEKYFFADKTRGWGSQLGANVQWGFDDNEIYYNDLVGSTPKGTRLNLNTKEKVRYAGGIFGVTPDRKFSFSPDLSLINAGILGYGVPEDPLNKIREINVLSEINGIWLTDLITSNTQLFLSIKDIFDNLPEEDKLIGGTQYIFNVKVSPCGEKLLIIMFSRGIKGRAGWPTQLITCDIDGKNIKMTIPDKLWQNGGHHPNWTKNQKIVMNLREPKQKMRFVRFSFDGAEMETLANGIVGGGHPSIDPSGNFLLTDAYVSEGLANSEKKVPLRLIDLRTNEEFTIAWIDTLNLTGPKRVDPHPVWSRDGKYVYFNGVVDGFRQIFRADVSNIVS
jgi:hypothetical protein